MGLKMLKFTYIFRYLVIVFYHADWDCVSLIESFSSISPLLESSGAKVVACSSDSADTHKSWIKAEKYVYIIFVVVDEYG